MIPVGSIPTMITPFLNDGAIDWERVDQLVNWHFACGCVGIFSPCQSSEMYNLTREERLALAKRVNKCVANHKKTRKAVHVAVGTYGGSIEEQAAFVNKLNDHCDAVVVVTCFMDPDKEGDDVWRRNAEKLLSLTPGVQLGLYECPVPYKRLLSPELLAWCAQTGRFHFHKDTSCNRSEIKAKIEAIKSVSGSPFRFFNANAETLQYSMDLGGDGFSGISANFYPHMLSWLVATMTKDGYKDDVEAQRAVTDVQHFLSVAELVVGDNYPGSAKQFLSQFYKHSGKASAFAIGTKCRVKDFVFNEQQEIRLTGLGCLARNVADRAGILEFHPMLLDEPINEPSLKRARIINDASAQAHFGNA